MILIHLLTLWLPVWWPGLILGVVVAAYSAYWAISMGYGLVKVAAKGDPPDPRDPEDLPYISIIIPARDEAGVLPRTVSALESLRYPRDRMEVIFAEDGSRDNTLEILRSLASGRSWMKVRHVEGAGSKAAAMNRVLEEAKGDLIYVLDADAIPEPDALIKVASLYKSGAKAIVGRYAVANAGESAVSRMVVLEELAWHVMCEGRSWLSLPCPPPAGSNYAVDRELLIRIGGFREGALAEDAMLVSSLVRAGVRPKYSGVVALVSAPTTLRGLFRQRVRWYRGYLEAMAESLRGLRRSADKAGMLDVALLFSSPAFAALGLADLVANAWMAPWAAMAAAGAAAATLALWAYMRYLGGYYGRSSGVAAFLVPYALLTSAISAVAVALHVVRARKTWHREAHSPRVDRAWHLE